MASLQNILNILMCKFRVYIYRGVEDPIYLLLEAKFAWVNLALSYICPTNLQNDLNILTLDFRV